MLRCEVILCRDMAQRGQKMLQAMAAAAKPAGVKVTVTQTWTGRVPVVMSYGLGHPVRRQWTRTHVRRGGRLIGWDLGYWLRDEPLNFHMRVTIDDDHPHRFIRPMPAGRFEAAEIELREDFDLSGPIVLCGLGKKQRDVKGYRGQQWELEALQRIRRAHPGKRIVYHPKRAEPALPDCTISLERIEDAIRGASLVVCSHSNVAVDACIAGVPVECEDGAAFALYRDNPAPSREQRLEFLRSLAWWQWTPQEAVQAWQFLKERLSA